MTRDEAIAIEKRKLGVVFDSADPDWKNKIASSNIDVLIELGLLKVEEPYKPIFIYGIGGVDKLGIDIRYSTLNITPIVDKVGDTIGLTYDQVQELKTAIRKWEERCFRNAE